LNPLLNLEPYKSFFDFCKSPDTKAGYSSDFLQFRKVMGKDLAEATEQDLIAYLGKKREAGIQDQTLTRYMAGFSKFFKWQQATHQRVDNPSVIFTLFVTKPATKNPKSLTIDQRKKLMSVLRYDTVHDFQVSLFVVLGLKTGLRLSEMMRLKWSDIDLPARTLKVIGKGQKFAVLNVPEPLVQELTEFKTLLNELKIVSDWLFFNEKTLNRHHDKSAFGQWCRTLKRRCGFKSDTKFSPHVLRHTFCTSLNEAGVEPSVAIKATRHSQIQTYISSYVKIEAEKVRSEVDRALS
jgi:site-specific recombinase XerD